MLNSFVEIFLFKINRAANENFPLQVLNFMAIENLSNLCLKMSNCCSLSRST